MLPIFFVIQTTSCTVCPAGKKCPSKSSSPDACPSGTYSTAGSTDCTDCPTGQSCIDPAASPVNCDYGDYSPLVSGTEFLALQF